MAASRAIPPALLVACRRCAETWPADRPTVLAGARAGQLCGVQRVRDETNFDHGRPAWVTVFRDPLTEAATHEFRCPRCRLRIGPVSVQRISQLWRAETGTSRVAGVLVLLLPLSRK